MPGKRATVPGEVFGRRPTALEKLTGEADANRDTASPDNGTTVLQDDGGVAPPQGGSTVVPLEGSAASPPHRLTAAPAGEGTTPAPGRKTGKAGGEKTTFYLRPDQLDKLDELALAHRRRTGRRIDRQDIVRALIDRCTLDTLGGV